MAELDAAYPVSERTGPPGGRYANELFTEGSGAVTVYRPVHDPHPYSAAGWPYHDRERRCPPSSKPDEDRARVVDHLAELADLGISHAIVSPRRPWDEAALDQVAAMVPDGHAIPSASS